MTCCEGAQRVRVFRLVDVRTAGRHPLTTGAEGARHSALLRGSVSHASGGYRGHARGVRMAYTLPRDTTALCRTVVLLMEWTAHEVRGSATGSSPGNRHEARWPSVHTGHAGGG